MVVGRGEQQTAIQAVVQQLEGELRLGGVGRLVGEQDAQTQADAAGIADPVRILLLPLGKAGFQIGRASCRERV